MTSDQKNDVMKAISKVNLVMLEPVLPKLKIGRESGSVELNEQDCRALLFVLSSSVPIEPLIGLFHDLIQQTLISIEPKEG